jgi:hypothetical protein
VACLLLGTRSAFTYRDQPGLLFDAKVITGG